MADTTSTRVFRWVAFLTAGLFGALFLVNVIYYNRIRLAGGNAQVSYTAARNMFILNLILFLLALMVFIWALVQIITTSKQRAQISDSFSKQVNIYNEQLKRYLLEPDVYKRPIPPVPAVELVNMSPPPIPPRPRMVPLEIAVGQD